MITYELFKEMVLEKIEDYIPEEFAGMKAETRQVKKVNAVLDGLYFVKKETESISPTIYINDMYEYFQNINDFDAVMKTVVIQMIDALKDMPDIASALDFSAAKENIVFQLINKEQNKEMLQDLPSRDFLDLAVIYRWIVKADKKGIQSTIVNNLIAKEIRLTEDELFEAAKENTKRMFPVTTKSMRESVKEAMISDGMPAEIAEMTISEMPNDNSMWVIGNSRGFHGAASMLYGEEFQALAEKLGDHLYVLPSSIHEVIAVAVSVADPEVLSKMVVEVNSESVDLNERLSNQVYCYDKDLRRFLLATDTKNKRLDEILA